MAEQRWWTARRTGSLTGAGKSVTLTDWPTEKEARDHVRTLDDADERSVARYPCANHFLGPHTYLHQAVEALPPLPEDDPDAT